jgi:hypothetical protein
LKRTHDGNASDEYLSLLDDLIMLAEKHGIDVDIEARNDERLSDLYARRAFRNLQQGKPKKAYIDVRCALSHNKYEPKPYILAPAFILGPFKNVYLEMLEKLSKKRSSDDFTQKIKSSAESEGFSR